MSKAMLREIQPALNNTPTEGINSIAFTHNNVWVIVSEKKTCSMHLNYTFAEKLIELLNDLERAGAIIHKIFITPTDDWIIVYYESNFVGSM